MDGGMEAMNIMLNHLFYEEDNEDDTHNKTMISGKLSLLVTSGPSFSTKAVSPGMSLK